MEHVLYAYLSWYSRSGFKGKGGVVFKFPVKFSNISREFEMTFIPESISPHNFVEWMALAPAIILQMAHMQQLVTALNTL